MTTRVVPTDDDPAAPFGRDTDGDPIAPYGLRADGVPRKSAGGRRTGPASRSSTPPRPPRRRAAAPSSAAKPDPGPSGPSNQDRKDALISLSDMFLVNGLVAAAISPVTQNFLGPRHAAAIAGDAVIIDHYAPAIADGLIAAAETRPGILSWMDGLAEKAPYLLLIKTGIELTKALATNHMNPSQRLAQAGVSLAQMNVMKLAETIEREAAEMGIPVFQAPDEEAA